MLAKKGPVWFGCCADASSVERLMEAANNIANPGKRDLPIFFMNKRLMDFAKCSSGPTLA
jgi:hypothetical protein